MPGTIIITPKLETGKKALKIPMWLFDDSTSNYVQHILNPEEWDVDS